MNPILTTVTSVYFPVGPLACSIDPIDQSSPVHRIASSFSQKCWAPSAIPLQHCSSKHTPRVQNHESSNLCYATFFGYRQCISVSKVVWAVHVVPLLTATIYSMLPESLLCLLSAALAYSQTTQSLTVNNVTSFNTLSLPSTSSFSLPQSEQLLITITLCSKSSSIPQFFVSNSSNSATLDHPEDSFSEIQLLSSGLGSWFGRFANGGVLAIESSNSDGVVFDIGISDSGMHLIVSLSFAFITLI
jgi:hypothetical protein